MAKKAKRAKKIHKASSGAYAPDVAVHEGRVEVVVVDAAGRRQGYGQLVARRRAGRYLVQLAHDHAAGVWWVLGNRLDPPRTVLAGFRDRRREDAQHTFNHATEGDLDAW